MTITKEDIISGAISREVIKKSSSPETFDDFLAHYGVLGMKWGVRNRESKQRIAREKSSRKTSKKKTKQGFNNTRRVSNKLRDNPQNRKMTDAELRKVINRLQMEKQLAQLTAQEKQPPSRMKSLMKDVTYDVVKGASTEVGKMVLSQVLKTNYNKIAGKNYQIPMKEIKKITDKIS